LRELSLTPSAHGRWVVTLAITGFCSAFMFWCLMMVLGAPL